MALSLQLSMAVAVAVHVPACPSFLEWQLTHSKAYGSIEVGPPRAVTVPGPLVYWCRR